MKIYNLCNLFEVVFVTIHIAEPYCKQQLNIIEVNDNDSTR